jgi:hypothetical protein
VIFLGLLEMDMTILSEWNLLVSLLVAKVDRSRSVEMLISVLFSEYQLGLSMCRLNKASSLSVLVDVSVYQQAMVRFSIEFISGQLIPEQRGFTRPGSISGAIPVLLLAL